MLSRVTYIGWTFFVTGDASSNIIFVIPSQIFILHSREVVVRPEIVIADTIISTFFDNFAVKQSKNEIEYLAE